MKKHIIAILIIICILALVGVGIWLIVRNNKTSNLFTNVSSFVYSDDAENLSSKINTANELYQSKVDSADQRLTISRNIIIKLDEFNKNLNNDIVFSKNTSSTANTLNKSYRDLIGVRTLLLQDYDQYITRMSGNIHADGTAVYDLYNDIFNKTIEYITKYNISFANINNYCQSLKQSKNLKYSIYSLYSSSVNNLISNISNHQFSNTNSITILNNIIKSDHSNILINPSLVGGEFSMEALQFKQFFNNSNLNNIVENFDSYYNTTIDIGSEKSNEKLAVYYLKLILEV